MDMGGDASFFLPSGLADDDDEETIVLGGGIGHGLTTGGLLPSPVWEPSNDPTLDSKLGTLGANGGTLGQGGTLSDVQDSNTLFSMNTSNMNNMQSFYLHQPVQSGAGSDLNALNSYGFGNSKPPGFSATEHIDANDLNTGSRKPPGFSATEHIDANDLNTGSRNTIDEAYYPSQPEGFGVQNFGVGGNANASNRNFNLNDNFPGINSSKPETHAFRGKCKLYQCKRSEWQRSTQPAPNSAR